LTRAVRLKQKMPKRKVDSRKELQSKRAYVEHLASFYKVGGIMVDEAIDGIQSWIYIDNTEDWLANYFAHALKCSPLILKSIDHFMNYDKLKV